MKNILVLNCGSSSVKYRLFNMEQKQVITSGGVERIGLEDSFLKFKNATGDKVVIKQLLPTQAFER